MPINALVTSLLADQPATGVSTPQPGAAGADLHRRWQ